MWSNISAAIKYLCSVVEDGNADDVAAVFGNAKISAILDDFTEKEIIEGVGWLMKRMHAPSQGDVYQKISTGRNAVVMNIVDGTVSLIMPTSIEIYELSDLRKRFVFIGKNVDLSVLMGVLDDEDSAAASVEVGASGTAQPVEWNRVKETGIILSDGIIGALRTNSAKKCPVCGSVYGVEVSSARTAHRFLGITEYFVRCNVCGHSTKGFPTPYEAIAAWNEKCKTIDVE